MENNQCSNKLKSESWIERKNEEHKQLIQYYEMIAQREFESLKDDIKKMTKENRKHFVIHKHGELTITYPEDSYKASVYPRITNDGVRWKIKTEDGHGISNEFTSLADLMLFIAIEII